MNMHSVVLYGCAAAVVVPGLQLLAALAAEGGPAQVPPPVALLRAWRRPVPRVAVVLLAVMVVLGVVQTTVPGTVDALARQPHGAWWRAGTALLVQSSGWFQLLVNLAALAVVAPVAERRFGAWRTVLVLAVSGVTAQAVSMAGWSPRGGGDSVAICGLVGTLAAGTRCAAAPSPCGGRRSPSPRRASCCACSPTTTAWACSSAARWGSCRRPAPAGLPAAATPA